MPTTLLTDTEIEEISGGYTQPQRQLEELRRAGFWRVRLSRAHKVILERAHYEAVCAGAVQPAANQSSAGGARPQLQAVHSK
jgi:hypothetical protein